MKNKWFYGSVAVLLTIMVILSLGGGLWGAEHSIGHWTGKLFERVCHQNPERSFTFNGIPMAVNSRCFGIFLGLWFGWIVIPLSNFSKSKKNWSLKFLFLAVMLQIIDYTGNLMLFWENTNASRSVLGVLLGIAVAISISDLFQTNNKT